MSSPRVSSSVITGDIGLSEKLAQKYAAGKLKNLDKETVKAYLKEKFSWRIQAPDYREIPRNNLPAGLNVTVFNVPISIPESDDEVPTRTGDAEYNDDIEGNPPVYDGTNSTLPADHASGQYHAAPGEFEWTNATDAASSDEDVVLPDPAPTPTIALRTTVVTSVITEYVTVSSRCSSLSSTDLRRALRSYQHGL